ncbi:MAG TPA: retention module-containing protein, partial [Rhodocyclaceae bacterium]|nr:retention module-containing protein [Rhodocyclaceae bacterium]
MATTTQGTAIGVVSAIKGGAFARNAQGEVRRLAVGDSIYEGDVIITASGGSAEITPFGGPAVTVNEHQIVAIDEQVVSTGPAQDSTAGAVEPLGPAEAARVIPTAGGPADFNVLLEAEAAAAGLVAGEATDGGHTFVDLARVVEPIPTVGYEFPANPVGSPPVIEGLAMAPTENAVVEPGAAVTVLNDGLPANEDGSVQVRVSASAGDPTDGLTSVTITLPTGWVATDGSHVYTGTFTLPASG